MLQNGQSKSDLLLIGVFCLLFTTMTFFINCTKTYTKYIKLIHFHSVIYLKQIIPLYIYLLRGILFILKHIILFFILILVAHYAKVIFTSYILIVFWCFLFNSNYWRVHLWYLKKER